VTLLPITIFMYRAAEGATYPTAVFLPILIATSLSTFTAIASVAYVQKIRLWNPVILSYLIGFTLLITSLMLYFSHQTHDTTLAHASFLGNFILFMVVVGFIITSFVKKLPTYDHFITGAKEGLETAIHILPYLLAMLIAIGILRASGTLDMLLEIIRWLLTLGNFPTEFVDALPTALMKPFSGSGSRAMMIETMQHYGPDSFPATISSIVQGSTETTFYVLAVYFGAVGLTHSRHAIACALLADLVGIITAILLGYLFF
jgi:spore maturation protein SpmB